VSVREASPAPRPGAPPAAAVAGLARVRWLWLLPGLVATAVLAADPDAIHRTARPMDQFAVEALLAAEQQRRLAGRDATASPTGRG
jgi:hypothetical protein